MDALRNVIAKFAVAVDDSPLTNLDSKITKLKGNYGALAFVATSALAGAAAASYHFIEAASDATETQNKIEALFGKDGRNEIVAWSKTVEDEMGRAEYSFQKGFSDFAAFLDPMNIGVEKTKEMSKALAKLSVDLASFYNTSEKEAQMRLFSGISGETEAVRRLGIDISDTSLAELFNSADNPLAPGRPGFAPGARRNKGKGLASLTLQEKTQLRYYKIMKDTIKAQGDAARTAGGWANTMKRLQDRVLKFSVHLGRLVEGPGTGFLNLLEGIVLQGDRFVTQTKSIQTAMAMLGATAVLWTGRWIAANRALLASYLPLLGLFAELAVAFLIIEDFWTFITEDDAESGFKALAQAIEGIESPARVVRDIFKDWYRYLMGAVEYWSVLPTWLGGNGFQGRTGMSTDIAGRQGIDAAAAERRAARTKAMQADSMEDYVKNRRADQTISESEAEFRMERQQYAAQLAMKDPSKLTEEDYKAGYAFRKEGAAPGDSGHITVAPVVNISIATPKVDVGEIQMHAKKAVDDAAKTAAAKLRRRAPKE